MATFGNTVAEKWQKDFLTVQSELTSNNPAPRIQIEAIAKFVDKTLKPLEQTFSSMRKIGTKTPAEILSEGNITGGLHCLDKSAVIGALLKQQGFDAYLVGERIYHNGKALGMHFLLEVSHGEQKFTVNPSKLKTQVLDKWFGKERQGEYSFLGKKLSAKYKRIIRKALPPAAFSMPAFKLAGITNIGHYMLLAQTNPLAYRKRIADIAKRTLRRKKQATQRKK